MTNVVYIQSKLVWENPSAWRNIFNVNTMFYIIYTHYSDKKISFV